MRALYYTLLAVAEAAPVALLLALLGVADAWLPLLAAVLAGALSERLARAALPERRRRYALLAAGAVAGLWAAKALAGGGLGLLDGWGQAALILRPGEQASGSAYLGLLAGLYAHWRGAGLAAHDGYTLRQWFFRAAVALLPIVGLGMAGRGGDAPLAALVTASTLAFFGAGLGSLALAGALEVRGMRGGGLGRRGGAAVGGAVALVLLVGLLAVTPFGGDVAAALGGLLGALGGLLALALLPLVLLLAIPVEWLVSRLDVTPLEQLLEGLVALGERRQRDSVELLDILPPWLALSLQAALALLPILIFAALYLLWRRRASPVAAGQEEERESLLSLAGLAGDLRDLLAGLRGRGGPGGLRAALAALAGADPASRVRRSYIRMLLAAEERGAPRPPASTPREHAPEAAQALGAPAGALDALTAAYERARYHASSATDADADAAERSWQAIEAAAPARRAEKRGRGEP